MKRNLYGIVPFELELQSGEHAIEPWCYELKRCFDNGKIPFFKVTFSDTIYCGFPVIVQTNELRLTLGQMESPSDSYVLLTIQINYTGETYNVVYSEL